MKVLLCEIYRYNKSVSKLVNHLSYNYIYDIKCLFDNWWPNTVIWDSHVSNVNDTRYALLSHDPPYTRLYEINYSNYNPLFFYGSQRRVFACWVILHAFFFRLLIFLINNFLKKIFQDSHQSVEYFGSRSSPTFCLV